ncbi:MAG: DUF805 domain-containing protein [Pseudomonadota bacterium]
MMGPAEAVGTCLAKFARFSGRASRSEFWWFALFVAVGYLGLAVLDSTLGFDTMGQLPDRMRAQEGFEPLFEYRAPSPLAGLFLLAMALPLIAVAARRLNDRLMSPLWLIALLLPVAGWVVVAAFLALKSAEEEEDGKPLSYGSFGGNAGPAGRS